MRQSHKISISNKTAEKINKYNVNINVSNSINGKGTNLSFPDNPFYSCVLSYLAYE